MTAPTLSLARLFEAPALSGPVAGTARYAPDGRRLAYLCPGADDPERLDLWVHDLDRDKARCVVDARDLDADRVLSAAEQARRERARVFAQGIVELLWTHDGQALLFPLAGQLFRLELNGLEAAGAPEPLTPAARFITDVRAAPSSHAIAFLSESDLWLLEPGNAPRRLTHDGSDTVSCGSADFIAAEEMHRHEGYWFSPDSSRIAFTVVDTAPIPETYRYEITAAGVEPHPQRYPYAGGPNARTELEVIELESGRRQRIPWAQASDDYLARVTWLPDSRHVAVQRQSRDQGTLDLTIHDPYAAATRHVLRETSDTWINLHDDLHFLAGAEPWLGTALWSSERDGSRRLYRVSLDDGATTPLTPPGSMLDRLVDADESTGTVYFEGWLGRPVERHLYAVDLAGNATARQLTAPGGWHVTSLAPDHASFVDRHSSLRAPPSLSLQLLVDGERAGEPTPLLSNALDASHPYFPYLAQHAPSELGTLEADDGQTLWYRLTKPADFDPSQRYPVVVGVYGGPGVQRVMDAWPPLMQQYWARQGWLVFELDNRGSARRGRAFETPIHRQLGEAEVADQARGVDWLVSQPWVDADKIAVSGHSYGGYMALMCLAREPERFCAGIAVAPVTDWHLYDTHYSERYLGRPATNAEGYAASSVLAHLDGLRGALLLIHGMADDNVLFTHCARVMQALQDRGAQFELMTYPGAKHGLAGRTLSLHRFTLMTGFLERKLVGR